MKTEAGYTEGHLVVAAIRVLENRMKRPPTVEEIAELLGFSVEWTGVLVAALRRSEIVTTVESAFTVRVEVRNHLPLEELSREDSATRLDAEMKEFAEKRRAEESQLDSLFSSGEAFRRQEDKLSRMADEFKRFQPKKPPKASPLFKDPPPEED
jgi:hypothetical protein